MLPERTLKQTRENAVHTLAVDGMGSEVIRTLAHQSLALLDTLEAQQERIAELERLVTEDVCHGK